MFAETHCDPSFSPVILSYFKQNPLKEQDRLSVSKALNLSLVAAQEHLSNLLVSGKLARTLSYKYVLPEYKEEIENLSFTPVQMDYEIEHVEDNEVLQKYILKVLGEIGGKATISKLSDSIGISKYDLELSIMDLMIKGLVKESKEPGHKSFELVK